jgi:hypothetical protein
VSESKIGLGHDLPQLYEQLRQRGQGILRGVEILRFERVKAPGFKRSETVPRSII